MKKISLMLAMVLGLVMMLTIFAEAWQPVGSHISATLPPHKAYTHSFDLVVNGRFNLKFSIQGGSATVFLLNQEQTIRASAGQEPTQPGQDFIMKNYGVTGSGNLIFPWVGPGRYCVAIRNEEDTPIVLEFDVFAEAQ
jgi:hypothetical protein